MTHHRVCRRVHHHFRIHRHGKLHRLAGAVDAVVRVGRGYREGVHLGYQGVVAQHGGGDAVRSLRRQTGHIRVFPRPAVGHLAVANGGAKGHRLTRVAMTKHLIVRCVHHDLRVHLDGEVHRITRTSHTVRVGRCDGNGSRSRGIAFVRCRKHRNVAFAGLCETDIGVGVRPCITHRSIRDG